MESAWNMPYTFGVKNRANEYAHSICMDIDNNNKWIWYSNDA